MMTKTTGDRPLFTPEQALNSHVPAKTILIAVDDSDESARALHYVGAQLREIDLAQVLPAYLDSEVFSRIIYFGSISNKR